MRRLRTILAVLLVGLMLAGVTMVSGCGRGGRQMRFEGRDRHPRRVEGHSRHDGGGDRGYAIGRQDWRGR